MLKWIGDSLKITNEDYFILKESQSLLKWIGDSLIKFKKKTKTLFVAILVKVDRGFPGAYETMVSWLKESQSLLKWIGDSLTFNWPSQYVEFKVAILVKVDRGFPELKNYDYVTTNCGRNPC